MEVAISGNGCGGVNFAYASDTKDFDNVREYIFKNLEENRNKVRSLSLILTVVDGKKKRIIVPMTTENVRVWYQGIQMGIEVALDKNWFINELKKQKIK